MELGVLSKVRQTGVQSVNNMQSLLSGFEEYTGSVLDDPKQATEAAAGAVDARRHALGRKQAADMEAFFAPFVLGDERLLMDLCRDYEPYTVETLLHVPRASDSYFKLELEEDGYLSGLRGFDAWDDIEKARTTLASESLWQTEFFWLSSTACMQQRPGASATLLADKLYVRFKLCYGGCATSSTHT